MFRVMGVTLLTLATVVGAADALDAEKPKSDSSSAFTLGDSPPCPVHRSPRWSCGRSRHAPSTSPTRGSC